MHELAKLDLAALLAHGYSSLDETNSGTAKFRAIGYGKMGERLLVLVLVLVVFLVFLVCVGVSVVCGGVCWWCRCFWWW